MTTKYNKYTKFAIYYVTQMTTKYLHKIVIKYIKKIRSEALQNAPKIGFGIANKPSGNPAGQR
jgi:hypothetical protein